MHLKIVCIVLRALWILVMISFFLAIKLVDISLSFGPPSGRHCSNSHFIIRFYSTKSSRITFFGLSNRVYTLLWRKKINRSQTGPNFRKFRGCRSNECFVLFLSVHSFTFPRWIISRIYLASISLSSILQLVFMWKSTYLLGTYETQD